MTAENNASPGGIDPDHRKRVEERFAAWWDRALDEPLIAVRAPLTDRGGSGGSNAFVDSNHWWEDDLRTLHGGPVPDEADPADVWTDPDRLMPRYRRMLAINAYEGDWLPVVWPNFGPSFTTALLGADLRFGANTTWQDCPTLSLEQVAALDFDAEVLWWQRCAEIVRGALEAWDGRYVVGHPDWGAVFDGLCHLCGIEQVCIAALETPETVRAAGRRLLEIQLTLARELADAMIRVQGGTCSWLGCWSPGLTYPVQADQSVLLGPDAFREIVLPLLAEECDALRHAAYHLDGPDAVKHLDALLEIPSLRAIQWIPGAGAPPSHEWLDLYRRIQASGRNVIVEAECDAVPIFLKELDPRGLFIRTACPTLDHARRLLESPTSSERNL